MSSQQGPADSFRFDRACDEIVREESPSGLQTILERALLSFTLRGRRLLDFGCGGGASTMILARLLLETSIVGVELSDDFLSARQEFYGYPNVEFLKSPSGDALPSGMGKFDAIVMSAVFEHLLPQERKTLMSLLWAHLSGEPCSSAKPHIVGIRSKTTQPGFRCSTTRLTLRRNGPRIVSHAEDSKTIHGRRCCGEGFGVAASVRCSACCPRQQC